MKKKLVGAFILLCLLLFGTACSSNSSSTTNNSNAGQETGNSDKGDNNSGENFQFRVGFDTPKTDFIAIGVSDWAERVHERTNGQVTIEVFPGGQLGGEKAMMEQTQVGTLDLVLTALSGTDLFDNFFLPFMFRDTDHMWKVLRGSIGEEFNQRFYEMTGVRVLGYAYRSPRVVTSNKEIHSPDDVAGMKIRVPEMPQYVAAWEALGASPTPMAFQEVFYGLQQGVIDGQENPIETIYNSSFHEVQDYIILTNHVRAFHQLLMNGNAWDRLPAEFQQIMLDTWDEVADEVQVAIEDQTDKLMEEMKESGVTFIEVDQDEWREKTKDVWKEFTPEPWGEGVYEQIQAVR